MLNYTIDLVEKRFPLCVTIWLHVVEYNHSAIKFYEKNKFVKLRKLKRHYYIDKKDFAAIVLYKPIGKYNNNKQELVGEESKDDIESA